MALQQALDRRRYVARHELKLSANEAAAAKRKAEGELGGGDVLDDQRVAGHQHVPLALCGVHEHGDGLISVHTVAALACASVPPVSFALLASLCALR